MKLFLLTFFCALFAVSPAWAEPTDIVVHVRGQGSKFMGTSMSGAEVLVQDADSGAILAQGVTSGETGDTERIMREKHATDAVIVTPDTAAFRATLDLDRPTRIRVTARGPVAQPQAGHEVSSTRWMVPGKDVTAGNAWMLVLPGLAVDVLEPRIEKRPEGDVHITASVVMNCGCPLSPGGLWDTGTFEIAARIKKDGELLDTVPLEYDESTSLFCGTYAPSSSGVHEVVVYAYDPRDGNTGVDRTTFVAR